MTNYELIASAEGQDGDFAVRLTDDALKPWFSPGQTVYLRRSTRLENGDVGLFFSKGGMVFRQYCRDTRGSYTFSALTAPGPRRTCASPQRAKSPSVTENWCFPSLFRCQWIEF